MNHSDFLSLLVTIGWLLLGIIGLMYQGRPKTRWQRTMRRAFLGVSTVAMICSSLYQYGLAQDRLAQNRKEELLNLRVNQALAIMTVPKPTPGIMEQRQDGEVKPTVESRLQLLRRSCRSLAQDLLRFVARNHPRLEIDANTDTIAWDHSTPKWRGEYETFMQDYSSRFSSRVSALRDECAKHGLQDTELDLFFRNPANPIAVRILGQQFLLLADKEEKDIRPLLEQLLQPKRNREEQFALRL